MNDRPTEQPTEQLSSFLSGITPDEMDRTGPLLQQIIRLFLDRESTRVAFVILTMGRALGHLAWQFLPEGDEDSRAEVLATIGGIADLELKWLQEVRAGRLTHDTQHTTVPADNELSGEPE
ncbi:MAG TPA: hypothetical protein PLX97_13500 [Gemmatales bacterium]|nr:hypothetical protein [Gemmatales bacterium]